jgi:hypothetical protein
MVASEMAKSIILKNQRRERYLKQTDASNGGDEYKKNRNRNRQAFYWRHINDPEFAERYKRRQHNSYMKRKYGNKKSPPKIEEETEISSSDDDGALSV